MIKNVVDLDALLNTVHVGSIMYIINLVQTFKYFNMHINVVWKMAGGHLTQTIAFSLYYVYAYHN